MIGPLKRNDKVKCIMDHSLPGHFPKLKLNQIYTVRRYNDKFQLMLLEEIPHYQYNAGRFKFYKRMKRSELI